jgi:hypothetical protein
MTHELDTIHAEIDRRFALQVEHPVAANASREPVPRVSILVATYQHAPYIQACLDAILAQQTTFPFEILVGEDASTDGTRQLCIEYAERFPDKIRLFLRDRSLSHLPTPYRTIRLNGRWLRRSARGTYLASCEGDDYWCDPHKLQKQVEMMEQNTELALVHGDAHQYFQTTGHWRKNLHHERGDLQVPRDLFQALLTAEYRVITCTALYRRDLFEQVSELPSYQQSQLRFPMGDTPLWLELSRLGDFGYLDQPLGVYRTLEESASQSRDPRKKLQFQHAMLMMRIHYMDCYPVPDAFRQHLVARRLRPLLAKATSLGETELVDQLWHLMRESKLSPRLVDRFYHGLAAAPFGPAMARVIQRLLDRP